MKGTGLFTLTVLILMCGCENMPEELEPAAEQHTVSFIAEEPDADENGSRATHDEADRKAVWEYGDIIGCFAELCTNIKFTNRESDPADFSGTVLGTPEQYWFYFPYSVTAKADGTAVTSTFPSVHTLAEGDYSVNPPMTATSTDLSGSVQFRNAAAIIRLQVTSDVDRNLVKATFSGNGGETVAGTYTMDMDSETPEMALAAGGATSITVEGSIALSAGNTHSFILVLPPVTFSSGFTVKLADDGGNTVTKRYDKELVLSRNKAINVSSPIEFTAENSVAEAVLQMTSLTLTTGTSFTIDEENLIATASKTGFTDPTSLTLAMEYTAVYDGQAVTPTITLTKKVLEEIDDSDNEVYKITSTEIADHKEFTADLTMPHEITLTYGDVSRTYSVKLSQLTDTGLPVVYFNTSTGEDVPVDDKDTWITDSEIYIDADGRTTFGNNVLEDLDANVCAVKGRGNTTWGWVKDTEGLYENGAKRPYAIKLNEKSPVLGMKKHKRWVLLNNFADKSLLRNYVAFMIANAMADAAGGSGEWHPTGQPVELVVNGVHRGNYLLCEQIKIDKNRVKGTEYDTDLSISDGSEISYLLEGDRNWGTDDTETLYWESYRQQTSWKQSSAGTYIYATNYTNGSFDDYSGSYKFRWGLKSPDDGDIGSYAEGGRETVPYVFVNKKVTEVEQFLFTSDFESRTLDEINEYMNLDSFIEYWLTFEVTMNHEPNNPGSCYMHYYDADGKFYMGPVWDFDYGTYLTSSQFNDEGLYPNKDTHFLIANAIWYCRLLQNTYVQDYISTRWTTYKAAIESVLSKISTIKSYQAVSAKYNFQSESDYGLWNMDKDPNSEAGMTYSAAVDRILTNLTDRVSQLNTLITNNRYY